MSKLYFNCRDQLVKTFLSMSKIVISVKLSGIQRLFFTQKAGVKCSY